MRISIEPLPKCIRAAQVGRDFPPLGLWPCEADNLKSAVHASIAALGLNIHSDNGPSSRPAI
jgi:hypothetical protein